MHLKDLGRCSKKKIPNLSLVLLLFVTLMAGCIEDGKGAASIDWDGLYEREELLEGVDYELIPSNEPGWNWYVDKNFDFRFKLPKGWKLDEDSSPPLIFLDDPICESYLDIGMIPTVEGKAKIKDRWELADIWYGSDKRPNEIKNITVGGVPAVMFLYQVPYEVPEVTPFHKGFNLFFVNGDVAYEIFYKHASIETFDKYFPEILKMLDSFEFI
jgi:hypothetical protein